MSFSVEFYCGPPGDAKPLCSIYELAKLGVPRVGEKLWVHVDFAHSRAVDLHPGLYRPLRSEERVDGCYEVVEVQWAFRHMGDPLKDAVPTAVSRRGVLQAPRDQAGPCP